MVCCVYACGSITIGNMRPYDILQVARPVFQVPLEMNSTKVQNPRRRNICYVIIHVYVENCRKIHVLSQ